MKGKLEKLRELPAYYRSYVKHLQQFQDSSPGTLAVLASMEAVYERCAKDIERLLEDGPNEQA